MRYKATRKIKRKAPIKTYEPKLLNKSFLIRFYPDSSNTHTNKLVTVQKLETLIGERHARTIINRTMRSGAQQQDHFLRRGIRVTLYSK